MRKRVVPVAATLGALAATAASRAGLRPGSDPALRLAEPSFAPFPRFRTSRDLTP